MPDWWNGRHGALKMRCLWRAGSSPASGTSDKAPYGVVRGFVISCEQSLGYVPESRSWSSYVPYRVRCRDLDTVTWCEHVTTCTLSCNHACKVQTIVGSMPEPVDKPCIQMVLRGESLVHHEFRQERQFETITGHKDCDGKKTKHQRTRNAQSFKNTDHVSTFTRFPCNIEEIVRIVIKGLDGEPRPHRRIPQSCRWGSDGRRSRGYTAAMPDHPGAIPLYEVSRRLRRRPWKRRKSCHRGNPAPLRARAHG